MAEYRAVVPAENRLTRRLGPHSQLVVLHLRCLRFSTPTGLGVFELGVLALDCRLDEDEVASALTEASRKTDFSYAVDSEGNGTFWIPWQLEHDPPLPYLDNYKGHERRLAAQPESKEKARAVSAWNDWTVKTPAKPGSNGGRPGAKPPTTTTTPDPTTTTTETSAAPPSDKRTRETSTFKAPTVAEATAYFATKGFDSREAERFCDHYTSNGWKVGKTPMKDWQAAVRNWTRDKTPGTSQMGFGQTARSAAAPVSDYKEFIPRAQRQVPPKEPS